MFMKEIVSLYKYCDTKVEALIREVSLETLPNINIRDPSHDKGRLVFNKSWKMTNRQSESACFTIFILFYLQKDDSGWWEGTLDGKIGWFPNNYVKEISSSAFYFLYHSYFFFIINFDSHLISFG